MDLPRIEIVIDTTLEQVSLRGATAIELRGQWVLFYVLLATRADEDSEAPFLDCTELGAYGAWQHKASSSVGKEVARHLQRLERDGFVGLIEHKGRTRRWRLASGEAVVRFVSGAAEALAWAGARRASLAVPSLGPLEELVEATLALHRGAAEEALERAWPLVTEGANDAAWRAVVAGRAAQRTDSISHLDELERDLEGFAGAAVRAARARLSAARVFDQRFFDPDERLGALRGLAARLEAEGDIGSLGTVLNVMGLLARRAGHPEEGAAHLRRASALFGISGDMPSLQASLFNLALCRQEALSKVGLPPDDEAMSLIDICLKVCASFGVGGDSAQAEITGCRWALRRGERDRAWRYLADAERIVSVLPSSFEQACFLRARAELALDDGEPLERVGRDLRTARRLFAELGDAFMVRRVERQLVKLGQAT